MNTLRRRTLVGLFSIILMVAASFASFAGGEWCTTDPLYVIDGAYQVHVNTAIPANKVNDVTAAGTAQVVAVAQNGTRIQVTPLPGPFPVNAAVSTSGAGGRTVILHITQWIPNDKNGTSFPVALQVEGGLNPGTVYGMSGSTLSYDLTVYTR